MSTQFESSAVVRSAGAPVHFASAAVATAVPAHSPASARSSSSSRTLSWIDGLTLAAIGVVVVVVTLPVLRGFGLRENERDALRMLRILAAEPAGSHAPVAVGGQVSLAELAARDRLLPRRLEDLESLPDGRLRRHGYLFDVAQSATGEPMLRAWPWEHAQTGRGAFVWTPGRGLIGHANADGRYSGLQSPPAAGDVQTAEWVALRRL